MARNFLPKVNNILSLPVAPPERREIQFCELPKAAEELTMSDHQDGILIAGHCLGPMQICENFGSDGRATVSFEFSNYTMK